MLSILFSSHHARPYTVSLWILLVLTAVSACQTNSEPTGLATVVPTPLPTLAPSTAIAHVAETTATPTQNGAETAVVETLAPGPSPTTNSNPSTIHPSYPQIMDSYPQGTQTSPTATAIFPTATPQKNEVINSDTYLPLVNVAPESTIVPTETTTPLPTSTATVTPIPVLDFTAVRASLATQNQELAFVKIGFHVTLMHDPSPLDRWMEQLDAADVPIFLKSVDNAEPLFKAQNLRQQSGIPHTLVWRSTGNDVPLYHLPPQQAAQIHWEAHREKFPAELDPGVVWIETINEVDKNQAEWLGLFAQETAVLAMNDGFKWAAFGWASGEPEPEHWQTPAMLDFLRLAGQHPDRLAVALHEYSYDEDDIADLYPYKIGRFQQLFHIVDQHAIPRPTVLITEWGWEYRDLPSTRQSLEDIRWAAELYAAYPEVKGAAIWHYGVGCCWADISQETKKLFDPLTAYMLTNYFGVGEGKTAVRPELYGP
ncbi:MAG: hypothetical protein AAF614_04365 [Chloroflexota bacterium]